MPSLRLVTWNCRSGAVDARLAELAPLAPDVVFLQECAPGPARPRADTVLTRRVNGAKGIAMASLSPRWRCELVRSRTRGGAALAARVSPIGPAGSVGREPASPRLDDAAFSVLGLWTHGPAYADDALRMIAAHGPLFAAGPVVVMGDFNSGTHLGRGESASRNHERLVRSLESLGLVSAYHAFHGVAHARETHATYYHRFDRGDRWHIDFCFVPSAWSVRIRAVEIAGPDEHTSSDHRPVVVELAD